MLLSLTVNGTTYYTVDGHGDIVQLTDSNGSTQDAGNHIYASYTYDAWGNILSQTGTVASLNSYRYAGYRYDEATSLYYLTARYYDPSVGRFLSVDPESTTSDYTYAGNNPLSYIDPNGHWIFDVVFLAYDIASFIANPTWEGAAWLAVDAVSTAIPTGSISLAARAARAVSKAARETEEERSTGGT